MQDATEVENGCKEKNETHVLLKIELESTSLPPPKPSLKFIAARAKLYITFARNVVCAVFA